MSLRDRILNWLNTPTEQGLKAILEEHRIQNEEMLKNFRSDYVTQAKEAVLKGVEEDLNKRFGELAESFAQTIIAEDDPKEIGKSRGNLKKALEIASCKAKNSRLNPS